MSDDEEIICEGKSLYNHLVNLGYNDFEAFTANYKQISNETTDGIENCNAKELKEFDEISNKTPRISSHECKQLITILSSQLLFQEDTYLIESILSSVNVLRKNSNPVCQIGAIITGLLSSAFALKKGVGLNCFLPVGLTGMFSLYSSWCWYQEYKESCKSKILNSHVYILKNLCVNVLKLLRFIKETEILSTGQVSSSNVGSAMYCPMGKFKENELDKLPQWKSLPHLRKCLVDSLVEIVNLFLDLTSSLKQNFPCKTILQNHHTSLSDPLKDFESISKNEACVSVKDLQAMCDVYLIVQSEYLKEVALVLAANVWEDSLVQKKLANKEVFKLVSNLTPKLTNISSNLRIEYRFHNLCVFKPNKTFDRKAIHNGTQSKETSNLQTDVHNIYLLIYSALLRVRSLEDYLENLLQTNDRHDNQNQIEKSSCEVNEQLEVLQADLLSTVKCYDTLLKQIKSHSKPLTNDCAKSPDFFDNTSISKDKTKINITGITVGASDFNVNSPDEVFLAISNENNDDKESCQYLDEWGFGKKPQIPKSLLAELSETLKSRKQDFIEREKAALKRQGLQGVENKSEGSADENEESGSLAESFKRKTSFNYKKHYASTHSSDSDDEMDPFESGMFLKKLKSKKYETDSSYTESDASNNKKHTFEKEINNSKSTLETDSKPFLNNSSLANLAAMKSQMWGHASEECYSDGSDS